MPVDLYAFDDYKAYLNSKLDELDRGGRGSRAKMSRAVGCQTAYTAQVLRGNAHFSLEQADGINEFLGHTEDQADFFLLLVQFNKAGTPGLKSRLKRRMEQILEHRALLKNQLGIKEGLEQHEQLVYYSSWIYGAVHALASIPNYQSPESIATRLAITVKHANDVVAFLLNAGILKRDLKGKVTIGKSQIHIGSDSPLVSRHHLNWRLQAMRSIERQSQTDLHYSSVVSISASDQQVLKAKIISSIKDFKAVIRESEEEKLCCLSVDFFEI